MLGLTALGSAALGTDGSPLVDQPLTGVVSMAAISTIAGNNRTSNPTSVSGTSAVGSFTFAQSIATPSAVSAAVVGNVAADTGDTLGSSAAMGGVGVVELALAGAAIGTSGAGIAGTLVTSFKVSVSGVSGTAGFGSVIADVGVAVGAFPITSDGVLGLWTLGDAALGVDASPSAWFSGVAGVGVCDPAISIVNNSVASACVVGTITANPATVVSAVIAIGEVGQIMPNVAQTAPGVAATILFGVVLPFAPIMPGRVVATGLAGAVTGEFVFSVPGVLVNGAAGSGAYHDPSNALTGCATFGAPGTIFSLSPSSAIGLWGTPVPGGTVTVSFAGLPNISVTITTEQSLTQIASALAGLINASIAINIAGISVRASANIIDIHQPQPAVISSGISMTGT